MIHLTVFLTLQDGKPHPCGELALLDANEEGRIRGSFRYLPGFLSAPAAFPLEPTHLPLRPEPTSTEHRTGLPPAIADSLPDAWGEGMLLRRARRELGTTLVSAGQQLLLLGAGTMGALTFADGKAAPAPTEASVTDLERLLQATWEHERGEPVPEEDLRLLLQVGSSPGGARPKALVQGNGQHLLAKFPSVKDSLDVVGLEAACLDLAKSAGLVIPAFELKEAGGRKILLLSRFDRCGDQGRIHTLTALAFLGLWDGHYAKGYPDIEVALRKHSAAPAEDVSTLFRQMAFNALLGNTDDHLKNFSLQYIETHKGWRLSPAYDLVPNVGERIEHAIHFHGASYCAPSRDGLVRIGKEMRVSQAAAIVEQVADSISTWRNTFARYGVPDKDAARVGRDIDHRLGGAPSATTSGSG